MSKTRKFERFVSFVCDEVQLLSLLLVCDFNLRHCYIFKDMNGKNDVPHAGFGKFPDTCNIKHVDIGHFQRKLQSAILYDVLRYILKPLHVF